MKIIEDIMRPVTETRRYTVRDTILLGLLIGSFLGAVTETVTLLRAPVATAAVLDHGPQK